MKRRLSVIMWIVVSMVLSVGVFAAEQVQPQLEVLTLEECQDLALKNSQKLKSAAKIVEIAKEDLRKAEGGLWPTVGYELGASKFSDPPNPLSTSTEGSAGKITVTQNLYTGGKVSSYIKKAKLGLDAALEDERKAKQQLTYDVKDAYYKVWLADQMFRVARSSYANMGHHFQQVKNFYQVGTSSKFDLLRAQVQWEGQKPQIIKAENGLALAKLSLTTLLGIEKDRIFTVSYDLSRLKLPEQVDLTTQVALDKVYQDRPEMRKMLQKAQLDELDIRIAYAAFKPNVLLMGEYKGESANYDPSAWEKTWSLTLAVKGNIFDGFASQAGVARAKKNEELTAITETSLRDQLRLEVEMALQSIKESLETSRASQLNIDLSKESLRLTQARFDAGMATTMDIMDAQLALDKALSDYYGGVSSYLTSLAKLDLVMGKDI